MLGLTGSALFAAILPHFLLVRLDGVLGLVLVGLQDVLQHVLYHG